MLVGGPWRLFVFVAVAFDELADEGVGGGEELVGRAFEVDEAFAEVDDAVGDRADAAHVVGDDDGSAAVVELSAADEPVDAVGDDGVEACGGFVVEDAARAADDGAGEGGAFAHAAGECGGEFVAVVGEADGGEDLVDAGVHVRGVLHAGFAEREGDIFCDGETVEEGAVLEEHADFAAVGAELAFVERGDFGVVDDDGA